MANARHDLPDVLTSGDSRRLDQLSDDVNTGHARIMHAYTTLSDTAEQLASVAQSLEKASSNRSDESSRLDRLVEHLREENEVTKVVDERIRTELPVLE